MKWSGIGFRLILAFGVLSLTTLLVATMSFHTFKETQARLTKIQEQDMAALDAASRLNEMGRRIIATSSVILSSESNIERNKAIKDIESYIETMNKIMVNFPDYNNYFKELITQIGNSLNLLYLSEAKSQQLNKEFRSLLDGLFPLLFESVQLLRQLPGGDQSKIDYPRLKALLYYQAGLAEKLYNDPTYNELDNTMIRLEELGAEWLALWNHGNLAQNYPDLNERLNTMINVMSRKGRLFELKNQLLDLSYQKSFLLDNSQTHLHQLAVQIESYAARVNKKIDSAIALTGKELTRNNRLSLILALFSLLAAAGISWFYVRKNILERVKALQLSMRSIASGKLDTEVELKGRDEMTEMAKDVRFFQQTAQELEQTNHQLLSTQNELVQAGKLAALGELSVGITHEINQPLTAVNSHLHSASLWLDKGQPERAKTNLTKIAKLIEKTSTITRHLKSFARKSDGKLEQVNVRAVTLEALELLESRINELNCRIEMATDSEPDDHVSVLANGIRFEQVIVNVLGNALDAVEESENPTIRIQIKQHSQQVILLIKDNGSGIDPDDLSHIFDPFYTSKSVGKGLGLGLSIAYNIIRDFGGSLSADSQLGEWTEFSIGLRSYDSAQGQGEQQDD
ncbi:ATP-binding protein [Vibrio lamellibrachiae]|uniref:ATP-binding protein n=1 Tax=Vibrio lamellibrachiae TaxID=2910253 RepID=UPI003D103138